VVLLQSLTSLIRKLLQSKRNHTSHNAEVYASGVTAIFYWLGDSDLESAERQ
jgi:hypothetical protein